jgi:hypothetical protein
MWQGWSATAERAPLLARVNASLAAIGGLVLAMLVLLDR